jgi:hypothetical protein
MKTHQHQCVETRPGGARRRVPASVPRPATRPVWRLSFIAAKVPDAVARLVIQRDDIVAVGDTLFADCLSQTYRYLEKTQEKPHD